MPQRAADAPTGSEFARRVAGLSLTDREAEVRVQFLAGNVPEAWRNFVEVATTRTIGGAEHTVVCRVAPDYLAIGSDADFLLMPVTPATAEALADKLECTLPTRRMVQDIHRAATVKLPPSPLPPGPEMTTVPEFARHNDLVRQQREGRSPGALTSGQKKDIVLTPLLASAPGKVAIYGWHRADGTAIQPLYTGHTAAWVDYSHGARFVQRAITVDGKPATIASVLADPVLCELLSDEGPFTPPGFAASAPPAETVVEVSFAPGVTGFINAPTAHLMGRPLRLVIYAAPAGNTAAQTLGHRLQPGDDWHFDIQHIAAQTRWLRQHDDSADLVLVCLQCAEKFWPAWRKARDPENRRIPEIIAALCARWPDRQVEVNLSGHSAGGSFVLGFIDGVEAIPASVSRISFLDSNYAYSAAKGHPAKLTAWLKGGADRRLCVLAYHDSVALLNGKTFVSEAGGTWGRSHAMLADLRPAFPFTATTREEVTRHAALDGRIQFWLLENPAKAVLHTRLVEWNGFIHSQLTGTPLEEKDYRWLSPRVYEGLIHRDGSAGPGGK